MKSKNSVIYVILVYLAFIIIRPQERFALLGVLQFEKILIILGWILLFLGKNIRPKISQISVLVVVFYFWLLLSYLLSAYTSYYQAAIWLESYWKFIVLYFLMYYAINNIKDIYTIITGLVVILLLYQLYSWFDFIRGGSYVFQQGIKRIVGIWSSGVGAPNHFAMTAMLAMPFGYFWYKTSDNLKIKILSISYLLVSFASIIFSGTRSALAGAFFFILLNMKSLKQMILIVITFTIILTVSYLVMPDYLRHRYFSLIVEVETDYEISDTNAEIQRKSASSRFEGLVDGFALALNKPIVGYGPGTSAHVRLLVNDSFKYRTKDLQTHNLYGQILAESGFVGFLIFSIIIGIYFFKLNNYNSIYSENQKMYDFKQAIQNAMFLLLFFGMASHILYRYHWFLLFALHAAFIDVLKKKFNN